ncbi:hypothetical protein LNP00_02425 [Fructobacillus sp. M158]|uniref:hypothetical protein n=1 Tax=Fructobacillus parabroussonetiae TaxID=2713174 RepID=UPI00200AD895|nr:hypothetical protein [Fructobacillus parabroussonetiae]MCK8617224.1 hypothetical protein [Fructobacillus parabroussonetiae]
MTIELITSFDQRADPAVNWQIDQVRRRKADFLYLFQPHEDAKAICQQLGLALDRVFDMASQRFLSEWPDGEGLFLFDLAVPNQGQINLSEEGLVTLSSAGQRIADVILFADSYYLVQAISWLDQDQAISRKDIYLRTGQLFAKQYFNRGQLLQSDFYFGDAAARRSDFYFEKRRNYALVNGQGYPSYEAAEQDLLASLQDDQEVEITSAGSLATIAKQSVLALPQGLFDENGVLTPEIETIIQNPGHPVQVVKVGHAAMKRAKALGLPMDKLRETDLDA